MGGFKVDARDNTDRIYYAMSDDLRNGNKYNIWHESKIRLPMKLCESECLITNKHSNNPKIFIIGGLNTDWFSENNHWEYKLSEIVDFRTFALFMMDLKKV